jgi:hypothetical protein
MFKLGNLETVETCGTSKIDELFIEPAMLVKMFGPGEESDGYKVSGEYVFTGPEGTVYTVYDYKSTSLYDDDYPTPEEFWSSTEPTYFSIGSGENGLKYLYDFRNFINFFAEETIVSLVNED